MAAFKQRLVVFTCFGHALAGLLCSVPTFAAPLKVACAGTSAMQGLGSSAGHHVPDELGKALGAGFNVANFGVPGTTALASVSSSYAATAQMKAALAFNPDVVLLWFGGNDSFQGTWEAHKAEFKADYTSLVRSFQTLPTHPKTFLVRLWAFVDAPVRRSVLDQEILPLIDQVAKDTGSVLIDYRAAFANHPEYFPDGMHPNDAGTAQIGKFFADSVTNALAAAAGSGGSTSLGGTGGAGGAGSGGSTDAAAGMASGTSGTSSVGGASASSGASSSPSAGSIGIGAAPAGGSNANGGATSLPVAGMADVAAVDATGAGAGCSMSTTHSPRWPNVFWLLLGSLGFACRRRAEW
jgi:lysophospholipase L1-like esterase